MKSIVLISWMLFGVSTIAFGQKEKVVQLLFAPYWMNTSIVIPSTQVDYKNQDSINIDLFRYYVSGIQLIKKKKVVWQQSDSYHLIDGEEKNSWLVNLNLPKKIKYDALQFQLGIDSLTNVSGAMGGDLDPTKGMFWSWNTGYINFKLEGSSPVCPTRKNHYHFHLGGYAYPDACLQTITLNVPKIDKLVIAVNLDQFLNELDLREKNNIMIPGAETQQLAKQVKEIFKVALDEN